MNMWYVADGDITQQQTALMVSRVPFLKNPEKSPVIRRMLKSSPFSSRQPQD